MATLDYLPIKTQKEIKAAVKEIAHRKRTSASAWVSDLLANNEEVKAEIKKQKKSLK